MQDGKPQFRVFVPQDVVDAPTRFIADCLGSVAAVTYAAVGLDMRGMVPTSDDMPQEQEK